MQGTEKQVKWAMDIRQKKMEVIQPQLEKMFARMADIPAELAKAEALRDALMGKPASYWIDNRDVFGLDLMRAVGHEVLKGLK